VTSNRNFTNNNWAKQGLHHTVPCPHPAKIKLNDKTQSPPRQGASAYLRKKLKKLNIIEKKY